PGEKPVEAAASQTPPEGQKPGEKPAETKPVPDSKPSGQKLADGKDPLPRKGGMPPPKKKGVLPPPKGMSGIKGDLKRKSGVPVPAQGGIAGGSAPAQGKPGVAEDSKITDKPSNVKTKVTPTRNGTKSGNAPMDLGVTNSGLVRLKKKKTTHLNIIVIIGVVIVCALIIVVMYFVRNGMASKKPTGPKPTTRVNMNTIKANGSKPSGSGGSTVTTMAPSSPLTGEFNTLNRRVRKMPQTNVQEIDEAIKLWQEFVDKYEAEYPSDDKLKQAKDLIKALKDLKTMY
ncbi:MAG: hypothetical protein JW808_00100, partial [Victivallales bacterium]|nr:hypothetical protein [Victivallales bacterium]